MGLHVLGDWDSPVMPVMVYHIGLLATLSRLLYSRHIAMVVVGFPATALLLCRCRVCISASHTREDLDYALDCLRDLAVAAGLDFNNRQGLRGWLRRLVASGFSWRAAAGAPAGLPAGKCGLDGCGAEVPALESPGSRRTSSGGSSCSGGCGGGGSSTESSCSVSAAGSRPSSAAGSWGGVDDRVLSVSKA
jgi:hypothetical protein